MYIIIHPTLRTLKLCRQPDRASLTHGEELYTAHFPLSPLYYACSWAWWY